MATLMKCPRCKIGKLISEFSETKFVMVDSMRCDNCGYYILNHSYTKLVKK